MFDDDCLSDFYSTSNSNEEDYFIHQFDDSEIPKQRENTSINENINRPQCTIKLLGKIPQYQKLFMCNTCHMTEKETICEFCASFCHQSHQLVEAGHSFGYCVCGYGTSKCHCFLENPVEGDYEIEPNESRQCTFRDSRRTYIHQIGFHCYPCGLTGNLLSCIPCSKMCHCGHHQSHPINFDGTFGGAFCDCGDPAVNVHCLLDPPELIPYPLEMSFFPQE
jgi:hypothetical protein